MKVGDLALHRVITLNENITSLEALRILNENNLNYGILKNDEQIMGYVCRKKLEIAERPLPIKKFFQHFCGILERNTSLEEIEEIIAGGLGEKGESVFLIYEEPDSYIGILNFSSLLKALKYLEEQNLILNEEINILKKIIDFSSDEIYVTDAQGNTLMVNRAFEENTGIKRDKVLGRNVKELEKEGVFKPSVTRMVLEQKKQISIFQEYANKSRVLVTGTPLFNEDGSICRVIVNARDTAKLSKLKTQLEEIETLKEHYYQELVNKEMDLLKFGNIIAKSSSMVRVLNYARKVAEVDSPVLLLGETGVGKGLLARFIHNNSSRQKNLFVTINCGAIPENLLESELFGYEGGAFTGAQSKGKIGKIEMANKGTVFLDEIGDLPYNLQVKLLHVLQEGTITRVGGNKEIFLDVRFIAATNRDLAMMVKEGTFREDLFYRLNVIPIEIPPLRNRKDDIIPLVDDILEGFNQKYKKNKVLSPEVLEYFQNYSWPGNVRELKNVIERLFIVTAENVIELYHLFEIFNINSLNNFSDLDKSVSFKSIKKDFERKILEKLYRQYKSTYKVAEILNVNQSTVARKIKKYNIKY